jgi:hypothetical protein
MLGPHEDTAYADLMVADTPFIELRICLEKPPNSFNSSTHLLP